MLNNAVIGAGWGDEGKGLVTDFLASKYPDATVVRFSGGQQAGHTVVIGDKRHVFSNFGSGTLRGLPTYWSEFCTVDPIGIVNELAVLRSIGVNPILYINPKCPVTTPYDVYHNRSDNNYVSNGTVGVGVGTTWEREENNYSLLFGDLSHGWIFREKLLAIKDYYSNQASVGRFLDCCQTIQNQDNIHAYHNLSSGVLIFEGSQGLMLDQNIGIFPHVTRGNTGIKNVRTLTDKGLDVYYVTRAYQTRHGNGPMSTEDIPHLIKIDPNETNVDHQFQGKFRRGILDLSLLEYAIRRDCYGVNNIYNRHLVITCLDHLAEYALIHNGQIHKFNTEQEFIDCIAENINCDDILLSHHPESQYM